MVDETESTELPSAAEQALQWHLRLSSGDATEDDWAAHADWLAVDPMHLTEFAAAQDVFERIGAASSEVRAAYSRPASAQSAVRGPKRPSFWSSLLGGGFISNRPIFAAGMAVAVLALVVVGTLTFQRLTGPTVLRFATTTGEVRQVTLPDGSKADLDTNTALTVAYSQNMRSTDLTRGRAIFDVKHDENRPFLVDADGHEVRVLGTKFEVATIGDKFSVAVARGSVGVSSKSMRTAQEQLTSGDKVIYTAHATVPKRERIDPNDIGSWTERRLTFNDAKLSDVIKEVNRYFDGTAFKLDSPDLASLSFTGSLFLNNKEDVARNLSSFMSLNYRRDGDSFVLKRSETGKSDE